MDFNSERNVTSTDFSSGLDLSSHIYQQSLTTLGLTGFVATSIIFLAYLSYTPRIDKRAPAFTSDTLPFVGSRGFYFRRWSFWKACVNESKTGNFSFWLGKYHVVGVTGEAARKEILDNFHLDRVEGSVIHGVGPETVPPIHAVFQLGPRKSHSHFQRRILDLMKSERLAQRLPRVTEDARVAFAALATNKTGVLNPTDLCYRLVLKQSCRFICCDEVSEVPEIFEKYYQYTWALQHVSSGYTTTAPWLPSLPHMKRQYYRSRLAKLVTPIVERRMRNETPRADDALQFFIDSGDSKDYIVTFLISALFISVANAGKLAGGLLNIMANHPDWQEMMYDEIKAATKAHSTSRNASLYEQLDSIPLEAWETSFPTMDLLFKEAIRLHVAFPIIRQNMAPYSIPIPGSKEVIPSGSFVAYQTGDAHYNERVYPNANKLQPFRESRDHLKQSYDFLGWGNGRFRCVGQRWAKLQQNIVFAYALAMYQWSGCDANGQPVPSSDYEIDLDRHGNNLPKGFRCKLVPREKT